MSESKHLRWVNDYGTEAASNSDNATDAPTAGNEPAANDADGWQQYRHWISKAPAPRGKRSGIDPSLYTWKGYRNWTEEVRRNWSADSGKDSD
ncbi:MAG: hypothetical protein AAFX56_03195 [Pseudomonadota bacterium]